MNSQARPAAHLLSLISSYLKYLKGSQCCLEMPIIKIIEETEKKKKKKNEKKFQNINCVQKLQFLAITLIIGLIFMSKAGKITSKIRYCQLAIKVSI